MFEIGLSTQTIVKHPCDAMEKSFSIIPGNLANNRLTLLVNRSVFTILKNQSNIVINQRNTSKV